MALILNEDEKMLRESAEGFFNDNAPVSQLRALRDDRDETGYSPKLWGQMADMGFAGILISEEHGGVDMGYMAGGLVLEEMGKNLTASPFFSTSFLAATAINKFGTPAQKETYLADMASGKSVIAFAHDEGRKHAASASSVVATPSGNGFKLNGNKAMVVDGHVADHIIVTAKTDDGQGVFIVPANAANLERERTIMMDSRNAARLEFDDVEVTGEHVIGSLEQGEDIIVTVLNAGRAGLAAEMLGASAQVFSLTTDYLKERKQFGQIVGEFQALQHRASHLYCELELARSCVYAALTALDENAENATHLVSMAKAKVGSVAKLSALEAVQLHGGMGMTDELDIGLYLKRIRVAQELFGDANFHAEQHAQQHGF